MEKKYKIRNRLHDANAFDSINTIKKTDFLHFYLYFQSNLLLCKYNDKIGTSDISVS